MVNKTRHLVFLRCAREPALRTESSEVVVLPTEPLNTPTTRGPDPFKLPPFFPLFPTTAVACSGNPSTEADENTVRLKNEGTRILDDRRSGV